MDDENYIDDMLEEQYDKSKKLVTSLGFHPQTDSFNYELFDVDRFRLHVMDCVGALISLQKEFKKIREADDIGGAKRRVFWQSLMQVSSFAENEFQHTNEALSTLLLSFPDEQKGVDGRSWLPLHFAVSLEKPNSDDISAIVSSNPESIKTGSDSRLINPCHLFTMSSSANPNLMVLQKLSIHDTYMGQSITSDGNTPLHLAACHSKSVAFIKELVQIHPPALHMSNNAGKTPFCLVFENTASMAPNILREFLQADPELIQVRNEEENEEYHERPIHSCIQNGENPNVLEFLSILLETNHDLANVPTSGGLLPIHLAASHSSVEVMQMLYEYSPSSINVIIPGWGSVAHIAAGSQKLDTLNYIHTINPELILFNNDGFTPLSWAVVSGDSDCDFIKALYALGPTAISKVQFY